MNARSAKAKGQRAAKEVQSVLLQVFTELTNDDIRVTPVGVNGPDIQLSSKGKEVIPLAIEIKNQEKLNVWEALKQAEGHVEERETPVLVFKRNRSKTYAALELNRFLEILENGRLGKAR